MPSSGSWSTAPSPPRAATATAVERLFGTPQQVDLAALAAAYGVAHRPVSTTAELAEALADPLEGRSIIEVRTDRHGLGELHRAIRAAVATAVEGLPQT